MGLLPSQCPRQVGQAKCRGEARSLPILPLPRASVVRRPGRLPKNENFQQKWAEAGWPEETVEMFEVHDSGWPG
jgi:hypothetical protein